MEEVKWTEGWYLLRKKRQFGNIEIFIQHVELINVFLLHLYPSSQ